MRTNNKHCGLRLAVLGILASAQAAAGTITIDGTLQPLNPLAGAQTLAPSSGVFTISESIGYTNGANLFHSFGQFSIDAGETARFTATSSIENVISRVTGGVASTIDGTVAGVPGASFWFVNPAGIIVGPSARFDVNGTIAVGAADTIRFANGAQWYALPGAGESPSVLAVDPADFGFLEGSTAGELGLDGFRLVERDSLIADPTNQAIGSIFLAGGSVELRNGAFLETFGYRDNDGVHSAGEIRIVGRDDVAVRSGSTIATGNESEVFNPNSSSAAAGSIHVTAGGDFTLEGGSQVRVDTRARVDGASGEVEIVAGNIHITGTVVNGQGDGTGFNLSSLNDASNPALTLTATGDISAIAARVVSINQTGAAGAPNDIVLGAGGSIDISATEISTSSLSYVAGNEPAAIGTMGNITIDAGHSLTLTDSAVAASTSGSGRGGTITVTGSDIVIKGSKQHVGIEAGTIGTGSAGDIIIRASNAVLIGSESEGVTNTNISSSSQGLSSGQLGNAGDITIEGHTVDVRGSISYTNSAGLLQSNTWIDVSSHAFSSPSGNAGSIQIKGASKVTVVGALISSTAASLRPFFGSAGNAGTVQIKGGDITLTDARVDQLTYRVADATTPGRVEFIADDTVKFVRSIVDSSNIGSTVGAGEIFLNGRAVLLEDGSEVTTNAALGGSAGAIRIEASDRVVINTGSDDASPVLIASSARPVQDPIRRLLSDLDFFDEDELEGYPVVFLAGDGAAGSIDIESGADIDIRDAWVEASTASTVQPIDAAGAALVGNITVDAANSLTLTDSAVVASTSGNAQGGTITLTGSDVAIEGVRPILSVDDVVVDISSVEASTTGVGAAGNITIRGSETALIGSESEEVFTEIESTSLGVVPNQRSGNAGTVSIEGKTVEVRGSVLSAAEELFQSTTSISASSIAALGPMALT